MFTLAYTASLKDDIYPTELYKHILSQYFISLSYLLLYHRTIAVVKFLPTVFYGSYTELSFKLTVKI